MVRIPDSHGGMLRTMRGSSRGARALLLALAATVLTGCGTTSNLRTLGNQTDATPVDRVYVYSFLDFRKEELRDAFLKELESQIKL